MVRIAVIDDDLDFTLLVRELLRDQGWDVVICREERDAIRCVEETSPDVVLLDIRMSTRQSGWHVLEALQRQPATRHTPVIVCSAATDDLQARAGWMEEHGVTTLAKPFDVDTLLRLIDAALRHEPPATNGRNHVNGSHSSGPN